MSNLKYNDYSLMYNLKLLNFTLINSNSNNVNELIEIPLKGFFTLGYSTDRSHCDINKITFSSHDITLGSLTVNANKYITTQYEGNLVENDGLLRCIIKVGNKSVYDEVVNVFEDTLPFTNAELAEAVIYWIDYMCNITQIPNDYNNNDNYSNMRISFNYTGSLNPNMEITITKGSEYYHLTNTGNITIPGGCIIYLSSSIPLAYKVIATELPINEQYNIEWVDLADYPLFERTDEYVKIVNNY